MCGNGNSFTHSMRALDVLRDQAISELKGSGPRGVALEIKLEIDRAMAVLRLASHLELKGSEKCFVLPDTLVPTPSSQYRIVEDNETDEPQFWREVASDSGQLRLLPRDVVLMR